jgi:hypothetical protein
MFTAGKGDSLIVFGRQKSAVMTKGGTIHRELPRTPGEVHGALVTENGTIVVASTMNVGGTLRPLHVLSRDGQIVRSFGGTSGAGRAAYLAARRSVVPGAGDTFWAAPINRYAIELWDVSGRLLRTLVRNTDWFEPWTDTFVPERGNPGKRDPMVMGLGIVDNSLLAVCIYVPRDRSTQQPQNQQRRATSVPDFFSSVFDTVIEIIDPRSGSLVTTRRFSGTLRGFSGGNLISRTTDDATLEVFELQLVRR